MVRCIDRVLAAVVFMTWYMFTCIHTFTDCRASRPRFVELTNTLLGTLQTVSVPACKGTTSVVFKGLRRANASGRVCIWHDQKRAPDGCRISNKHNVSQWNVSFRAGSHCRAQGVWLKDEPVAVPWICTGTLRLEARYSNCCNSSSETPLTKSEKKTWRHILSFS